MKRLTGMAIVAAALAWASAGAAQQEQDPRVAEARAHFDQGEAHFEHGRYTLAAEEFQRSHELLVAVSHPNAALVLYNVARSLEEIGGREREARAAYVGFLESATVNADTSENVRNAQEHIRELDARLAAHGDGSPPSAGSSISPVGPIVLGGGGLVLATGLILGGVALARDGDLAAMCPTLMSCPESLRSQHDETRTLALASDVLIPAIKVARLAVAENYRARHAGSGRALIRFAYAVALDVSDRIGCRVLTADAYPTAVGFYERLGIVRNRSREYRGRSRLSMRLDLRANPLPGWTQDT